jgi:quercetin dioxygenase-like cupin family protein
MARRLRTAWRVPGCLLALGCNRSAPHQAGATAAASGVSRADSGLARRDPRFIPLRPMAGDVELLLGDPDSAGPFVMRIHELPGTIVPPHTHPVDENVTVVQGTWWFGLGERYDSTALHQLPAGAYAFVPAGRPMFAASPTDAIVQVSGMGPFHIAWQGGLATLEEPGSVRFRWQRGDTLRSPRGTGVVTAGYASGDLIEYELHSADGSRFMATEAELATDPGSTKRKF